MSEPPFAAAALLPYAANRAPAPSPREPSWALQWRGVQYTVQPARNGDLPGGLVCEPPIGGRIPGFLLRSEIHRQLQLTHPGLPLLFTDAARSAEIRRWVTEGLGSPAVTREMARWPEDDRHAGANTDPPHRYDAGAAGGHPGVGIDLALAILKHAQARIPLLQPGGRAWRLIQEDPARYGLPPEPSGAVPTERDQRRALGSRQLLHDLIADPAGPEVLRALWRSVRSLRVLDPSCGDGSRLLAAVELLTAVHQACLDQMRIWVNEIRLERRTRRAELLRDFRVVLARADGRAEEKSARDQLVLESILLMNIFGADADADAAARCLRRLHGHLRDVVGARAAPPEACNIGVGFPSHGIGDRTALARALVGTPDAPRRLRDLLEEAEAVDRADCFVRRMRLEHGADRETTRAGLAAIRKRRATLARALDVLAARADGVAPADAAAVAAWVRTMRPLHCLAEWTPATRTRGFHLLEGP